MMFDSQSTEKPVEWMLRQTEQFDKYLKQNLQDKLSGRRVQGQGIIWEVTVKLSPMRQLKATDNWRYNSNLFSLAKEYTRMAFGTVEMLPGWFEQAHDLSASLTGKHSKLGCQQWVAEFAELSTLLSAILSLINPDQYRCGLQSIYKLDEIGSLAEVAH
ncbi:hypothetical protein EW146_g9519 [Bondarzewia mesenterica]|uniref:Uncharacterized protein n=1 Tax=Bondarzewia mesenterica TaxID=1095465 RepID=A0A4S4L5K1_9AGAM|nr:hypothetical protein EW146_g9519 [Bondarzewia mesenterica]